MASKFLIVAVLFLCRELSFAVSSKNNQAPVVLIHVATGCFDWKFYRKDFTETTEDCKKHCEKEPQCAFVAFYEAKGKCALCEGTYKPTSDCLYKVEIVVKDVNECAIASEVNCKENEVCKNTLGSYKCHCKPGYYEESEHQCMKVPDVEWIGYKDKCFGVKNFFSVVDTTNAEACKLTCQTSSKCVMVEYQPGVKKKCRMAEHRKFQQIRSCDHGSRRTDLFVKAIIECDSERKKCPQHSYCHALNGNRRCRCRFGYKGNGKVCHDLNECKKYENLCAENAQCRNTIGSYKCVCIQGYHADGQLCVKDNSNFKTNPQEDITAFEKKNKGTFHTVINFFGNSGSRPIDTSSQFIILCGMSIATYFV